jgi:hypothetical protein
MPTAAAQSRDGRIFPEEGLTSSRVAIGPAADRAAAPFQVWTKVEVQRVTSAVAAVRAVRACHPAALAEAAGVAVASAVVAVVAAVVVAAAAVVAAVAVAVAAGGRYENIPFINTRTLKGEENDTSRN